MVVGGSDGKRSFVAALNANVQPFNIAANYLEEPENIVPTVINRFPGQDIFVVGAGGSVYIFQLSSGTNLEQLRKHSNICTGMMTDICIKGNTVYCKANGENKLKILVYNYQRSRKVSEKENQIHAYHSFIIRPYQIHHTGNFEKIAYNEHHGWIYVGGTMGITALKEDSITNQYVQFNCQV